MSQGHPDSQERVASIVVLPASPADALRNTLTYLRRKHPAASITLVAESAPDDLPVEETIPRADADRLKRKRFDLVILVRARGSGYWRPFFGHARLARALDCDRIYVITDDGHLFRYELRQSILQFLLIPFCRYLVSPLLILAMVPTMKLLRALTRLYSPKGAREINDWPTVDPDSSASRNTAMMRRQFEMLSRDHGGKVPRELCRERECIVCGENDPEKMFDSEDGFDYVRCRGCGYAYVNPILAEAGWEFLQREIPNYQIEAAEPFSAERQSDHGYQADIGRFSSYLKLIGKHSKGPGRLLDVGCSTGNFLRYARSQGWQVVGLEVEESRCVIGRERYGLDMVCGKVEEIGAHPLLAAGSFDAVTFWESMEHVEDPNPAIERARRALKQGGLLAMTVNNIDYVDALLLKQQCYDLLGIGHINMFNVASMTRWLERFHFSPLTVRTLHQSSLEELIAFLGSDPNRIYSFGNFDRQTGAHGRNGNGSRPDVHPRSSIDGLAFSRLFSPWLHYQMNSLALGPMLFSIGRKDAR